MARAVLLDSGPLGRLTHPRAEQNREVREWLAALVSTEVVAVLPEIVDYEHRRKMLHIGSAGSIGYLDGLKESIAYAPLTTQVMLRAAQLWADARTRGLPTAPDGSLDIDVILAAQALDLAENGDQVVVATTNPRHLSRFVDARDWQEIEP
jgi:predicted nucleic acid-binding protein